MNKVITLLLLLLPFVASVGCKKHALEKEIHQIMTNRMVTLSTAESCTGGAIAQRFTTMPGASAYFLCGMITYSNDSKRCLLGVSADSIGRCGIVSETIVRQMAEGIQHKTGSNYAIATTGFAGPTGGTPETPMGTVWIAIATPTHTISKQIHVDKNRQGVINAASDEAMHMLLQALNEE